MSLQRPQRCGVQGGQPQPHLASSHRCAPAPQALYQGLEQLAARMEVQLEMHVNEAPFARSFILSDCDLARVGAASCCHVPSVEKSSECQHSMAQAAPAASTRIGRSFRECIVWSLLYLCSSPDKHVDGWPAVFADFADAQNAAAADRGSAALTGHHLAARQPPDVLQHLAGKRCDPACVTFAACVSGAAAGVPHRKLNCAACTCTFTLSHGCTKTLKYTNARYEFLETMPVPCSSCRSGCRRSWGCPLCAV